MAVDFDEDLERGKMLAARLKEKQLSQAQLAEKLNVSQPTVSRWVNGRERVPPARYEQIAELLEIDVDMLESGTQYVRSAEQIERWRMDVLRDTPNIFAAVAIMALSAYMRENGEVHVHEDLISSDVETLTLDRVVEIWPSVLNSPYLERVPGARWVFRLKFLDEVEGGN